MRVIKFNRQVARYQKAMRERIEARIQQLEEEKTQNRAAVEMRECEINGSIQALRDVLTAMTTTPEPEQELQHVG